MRSGAERPRAPRQHDDDGATERQLWRGGSLVARPEFRGGIGDAPREFSDQSVLVRIEGAGNSLVRNRPIQRDESLIVICGLDLYDE
jgi:hypothetical protein